LKRQRFSSLKCLLYWYKSTCFTGTKVPGGDIHPVLHACHSSGTFAHFAKHSHAGVALVPSNYSTEIDSYLLVVHVIHRASQYLPDESRVVHLLSTSGDLTQKKIPGMGIPSPRPFLPPPCHTLPQQSIVLQELGSVIEVTERPHEDDLFRNQVVAAPLTSASMVNKVVRSPGHIEL
jgi:hypothetical protein